MKLINISLGLAWISFIVWRILLLDRYPYIIKERLSVLQICIVISIMTWNIVELASIIKQLQGEVDPGWIVKKAITILNIIYWGPLRIIEAHILSRVPSIKVWLTRLGDILVYILINKVRIVIILVILMVMPRLVVSISLGIDIVIYGRIYMMYKAIALLIIPIIFNVVIGMCKHIAQDTKTNIEEYGLVITYKDKQPYVQSKGTIIAILNYESNKTKWIRAYNILDTIKAIEILKHSPTILYMKILTVSIFIISLPSSIRFSYLNDKKYSSEN